MAVRLPLAEAWRKIPVETLDHSVPWRRCGRHLFVNLAGERKPVKGGM